MKTRIFASALLIPVFVFLLLGELWTAACVMALTVIACREMVRGFAAAGVKVSRTTLCIAVVSLWALVLFEAPAYMFTLWIVTAVICALIYGFKVNSVRLEDICATVLVSVYPGAFFAALYLIEDSAFSFMKWHVFLIAFGTDIMAYFTGYFLGKHKLCPVLSPKKTVEGAVGGLLGGLIACFAFNALVPAGMRLPWLLLAAIAIPGSVISQLGDLAASALKRRMGIKDYGTLIPGHGGIMDRFDSVLFVSAFIYLWVIILGEGLISL